MTDVKKISREQFEEIARGSAFFNRIYEDTLGALKPRSAIEAHIIGEGLGFSPNPEDYLFGKVYSSFCVATRLYDYAQNKPIETKVSLGWDCLAVEDLVLGISFEPLVPTALGKVEGARISLKSVLNDFKREKALRHNQPEDNLESELRGAPNFSCRDNVQIEKEKGRFRHTLELHGDNPKSIGEYVSRGILDKIYQDVMDNLKIKRGKVKFQYTDGMHPVPITYPRTSRGRYLFC